MNDDNDTAWKQHMAEKRLTRITRALDADTVTELDAQDADQLKGVIVSSQEIIEAEEATRDTDLELAKAKDKVAELRAPYTEAIKRQRAKIAYAMHRLRERGVVE